MSDDAKEFGELVLKRRKELRLTQEALAAAALNNLNRKGMISQIENGKIPNITRETVKKVAQALGIDIEEIPNSLRWPEASEVVLDTNTLVHEIQRNIKDLINDRTFANENAAATASPNKRDQLEAIAIRLDVANADSLDHEQLRREVDDRAKEFRQIKSQEIANLEKLASTNEDLKLVLGLVKSEIASNLTVSGLRALPRSPGIISDCNDRPLCDPISSAVKSSRKAIRSLYAVQALEQSNPELATEILTELDFEIPSAYQKIGSELFLAGNFFDAEVFIRRSRYLVPSEQISAQRASISAIDDILLGIERLRLQRVRTGIETLQNDRSAVRTEHSGYVHVLECIVRFITDGEFDYENDLEVERIRDIRCPKLKTAAHVALSDICEQMDLFEQALIHAEKAKTCSSANFLGFRGRLATLHEIYLRVSSDGGKRYLPTVERIESDLPHPRVTIFALKVKARIFEMEGEFTKARFEATKLIALANRSGSKRTKLWGLERLATYYNENSYQNSAKAMLNAVAAEKDLLGIKRNFTAPLF